MSCLATLTCLAQASFTKTWLLPPEPKPRVHQCNHSSVQCNARLAVNRLSGRHISQFDMLAAGALLAGLLQGIHSKALLQRKTTRQRHDVHKDCSFSVCEAAAGHAVCALLMLGMTLYIPSQILQSLSPFPQAANPPLPPHLYPTQPYCPIALSSQPCNPHHPTFPPPVPPLCLSQPDNSVIETCSRSGMMIT